MLPNLAISRVLFVKQLLLSYMEYLSLMITSYPVAIKSLKKEHYRSFIFSTAMSSIGYKSINFNAIRYTYEVIEKNL